MIAPRSLRAALDEAWQSDARTAAEMLGQALAENDERLREHAIPVLANALRLRVLARQGLRVERRASQ